MLISLERLQYAQTILLPESNPYHNNEQEWLRKPDTIPRYMRAAKWKLEDGKKRLKGTLEWRRQFKPDLISPDEVEYATPPSMLCALLN